MSLAVPYVSVWAGFLGGFSFFFFFAVCRSKWLVIGGSVSLDPLIEFEPGVEDILLECHVPPSESPVPCAPFRDSTPTEECPVAPSETFAREAGPHHAA